MWCRGGSGPPHEPGAFRAKLTRAPRGSPRGGKRMGSTGKGQLGYDTDGGVILVAIFPGRHLTLSQALHRPPSHPGRSIFPPFPKGAAPFSFPPFSSRGGLPTPTVPTQGSPAGDGSQGQPHRGRQGSTLCIPDGETEAWRGRAGGRCCQEAAEARSPGPTSPFLSAKGGDDAPTGDHVYVCVLKRERWVWLSLEGKDVPPPQGAVGSSG